jgi:transcription initiation factor TFIID subunit 11
MLLDAFTPDQTERYDTWRRVKLRKESVRKLTNHTLSQSVPASIITTINGYTKVLISELVERARDVQLEWMAATDTLPTGEKVPEDAPLKDRMKIEDRGPLTPDHMREAYRRYRKDREGGCAGILGLSLAGRETTAARMGGRKLFR